VKESECSLEKQAKFNISFKKHPRPTGLSSVGAGYYIDIKVNKKRCGLITGGSWRSEGKVIIQIAVKEATENCPWSWIFIKNSCVDQDQAKAYVLSILKKLANERTIQYFED